MLPISQNTYRVPAMLLYTGTVLAQYQGPIPTPTGKEEYCDGYKWVHKMDKCLGPTNQSALLESSDWKSKYKDCGNDRQSPIHIEFMYSRYFPFQPMHFVGFEEAATFTVENGVHAVYMTTEGATVSVFGGPLYVRYNLSKAVFHVGTTDHAGSEHKIDNNVYAAELQLLFSSNKPTTTECLYESMGVAMISILFQEQEKSNERLNPFIDATHGIRGTRGARVEKRFPMRFLMPDSALRYYVYPGSLTFPPCTSSLPVIVFTSPVKIGRRQLEKLRGNLYVSFAHCTYRIAGKLRELFPIADRPIFRSFKFLDRSSTTAPCNVLQLCMILVGIVPVFSGA